MTRYSYKGISRQGKSVSGFVEAKDEAEAQTKMRFMGVKTSSIDRGGAGGLGSQWQILTKNDKGEYILNLTPPGVSFAEVTIFTKQLSVLVNAGVSVVQCLEMLSKQAEKPYFRKVLDSLQSAIQSGSEFSDALSKYPSVFNELYCSLVKAGGASGALDVMLQKLSVYLDRSNKLRRQLRGALSYPIGVISVAIVLLAVQLYFVVPTFQKFFEEAGQQLPWLTQLVVDASGLFISNALYFVAGLFGIIFGYSKWSKTEKGKMIVDTYSLKIPIIGNVLLKIALARFATTMATLVAGGVALIETLETCAKACGNVRVESDVMKIRSEVAQGISIADAMERCPLLPKMMTGMVRVGEATGQLDQMFSKISDFYEEEVDVAMAQMLKLMEPILFVVLGGIVGVVLIAMYLPIFDLANTQTGG